MASKLTLISISSGFKGTDIETNFSSIEDEFDDTLSRTGKSPNTMEAELDMNSNKIRNLAQAANNSDAATLKDVLDQTTEDATSKPATAITISDTGGHYSSTNVEGALQEFFDSEILPSTNLSDHEAQVVELGGDFDAGEEVRCERIGKWVNITSIGNLAHTSSDNPASGTNIPSQFRPTNQVTFGTSSGIGPGTHNGHQFIDIATDGSLSIQYKDYDGTDNSGFTVAHGFSVTYLIT